MADSQQPLRANNVGSYGDLSERPNPEGLVIMTVPTFEIILPFLEREAGHKFSAEEIEAARRQAPSIVVTREVAQKMNEARSRRS